MTEEQQEKKNKRIALFTSVGIQAVVLLLLFLIIAWRPPDPPIPEYGIELNFGMDTQGSGAVQPETPVGNEGAEPEQAAQPTPEEAKPEVTNEAVPEEVTPTEAKPVAEQPVSKLESPVVVKEKKELVKPIEKPKEKVEEKKVEEKKVEPVPEVKPEVKPAPKEPLKAVYKPNDTAAASEKEGNKEGKPGNQGDDPGKTGDKGSPEGKLDADALYGQPGAGKGGVAMSGFNGFDWPKVQTPTLPDEAYGVYEFIVKVDDQGDVISVTPLQRGLSLEAERKLKEVIQRLVFVPKGSNLPPQSEGRITFRVVSK
jgi:outer membrane biosynthesis protein TonB